MIAFWILTGIVVAGLAAAAAAAAERGLRLWRRQARRVWAVALAVSVVVPAGVALAPPRETPAPLPAPLAPGGVVLPTVTIGAGGAMGDAGVLLAALDRGLGAAWALASALLLARLGAGVVALRRARRRWPSARVDGARVLVAPDAGPLVVGVRRPCVVLPQWALALDPAQRALVVRHETEHARTRDPALLLAAAAAVALTPWNPGVWWIARRLRLAVELDCDARVLRAHPEVRRYGLLLVDVARRVAARGPALTAALLEPTTDLERRIAALHPDRSRHRPLLTVALGAAAALAALGVFAACRVSEAVRPQERGEAAPAAGRARPDTATVRELGEVVVTGVRRPGDTLAPAALAELTAGARAVRRQPPVAPRPSARAPRGAPVVHDGPYFEFQVEKPVVPAPGNAGPRYPQLLKAAGVEGEVLAQFVVDTEGRVELQTFKVLASSHRLLTDAVRGALEHARYLPAEVGGKKVKQLVQQPFRFQLSR